MKAPVISISLPLYNGAHELEARLDNIASQAFGDFQVLMFDSASIDATGSICRRYASKDHRFKYFRAPQKLPYIQAVLQNMYRGLDRQYFVLTSHGQRWAPTYLEECLKALKQCPQALAAYSWCQFTGEDEAWPAELPGGLHKDEFDLSDPNPVRRFLSVMEHQKFYTPYFGLIQTEACFKALLMPENLMHEHLMTAVSALNAPLIQIDKPLLFRRWQPFDASLLDIYCNCLGQPMELKPTGLGNSLGYKTVFFGMLGFFLGLLQAAPHLDSRQREILAGQAAGLFIRRYRTELAAEMDANIDRVIHSWFYVWRAPDSAQLTSKNSSPLRLPDEDADTTRPPRPNLDLSVLRVVNANLSRCQTFFPTHPRLSYALGLTYWLLNRRTEAKAALDMELRNNPDYEAARQTLREWIACEKDCAGS